MGSSNFGRENAYLGGHEGSKLDLKKAEEEPAVVDRAVLVTGKLDIFVVEKFGRRGCVKITRPQLTCLLDASSGTILELQIGADSLGSAVSCLANFRRRTNSLPLHVFVDSCFGFPGDALRRACEGSETALIFEPSRLVFSGMAEHCMHSLNQSFSGISSGNKGNREFPMIYVRAKVFAERVRRLREACMARISESAICPASRAVRIADPDA